MTDVKARLRRTDRSQPWRCFTFPVPLKAGR